jgi:hypothetical protein
MTCELLQISGDDIVIGLKLGVNKLLTTHKSLSTWDIHVPEVYLLLTSDLLQCHLQRFVTTHKSLPTWDIHVPEVYLLLTGLKLGVNKLQVHVYLM